MDQAYLLEKPIYCYFSEGARQAAYAPIKNVQSLNNLLQEALTGYNEVYGVMSLASMTYLVETPHVYIIVYLNVSQRNLHI